MRTSRLWAMGLAVVLGGGGALLAGDDENKDQPPWKHRGGLLSAKPTPGAGKSAEKKINDDLEKLDKDDEKALEKSAVRRNAEAIQRSSLADEAIAERAREEAVLLRRLAVCEKLKQVAFQTNDRSLEREAEELDQKAWAAYSQRTAHLSASDASLSFTDAATDAPTAQPHAARKTTEGELHVVPSKDSPKPALMEEKP
jgi:hypothetical protein